MMQSFIIGFGTGVVIATAYWLLVVLIERIKPMEPKAE